jgi:thiol-disulfide isomerase/thioredoxin
MVFGSPTCRPCQEVLPHLDRLSDDLAGRIGIVFLSVASPEDNAWLRDRVGVRLPILSIGARVMDLYEVRRTPFAFLVELGDGGAPMIRGKRIVNNRPHLDQLLGGIDKNVSEDRKEVKVASVGQTA